MRRVSTIAEPRLLHQRGDLLAAEAEPAMREMLAQRFLLMRGEIDDEQPAARAQQRAPPRSARGRDRRGSAAPDG